MAKFVRLGFLGAALVAIALPGAAALAHEFWIAPERGHLEPGERIVADLKVGQMLRGDAYPYLSSHFKAFTVTDAVGTNPVAGYEGDIPALDRIAERTGLHVLAHHTIAFRVTYDDWSVFRRYLAEEGLDRFAELHRERGLPATGFAERYTRCAKALVQVGATDPSNGDISIGMPIELVAETNPYDPGADRVSVRLLWQGAALANRQINVFHDSGSVGRTSLVTDETGRAEIPLSGAGEYLLNAVHLQPVDHDHVVWESHWATLSFKLPRGH